MAKRRGKILMIVDGNALVHRAFHALPPTLRTRDGELVNAVYGFAMILLKALAKIRPEYAAVTFDVARKTFRDELYKEYKAHRVKAPDELYEQIPRVKEVVQALNIPIYEKAGFEADDVLATLSNQHERYDKNAQTIIVTGDMDTLQLVDHQTKVFTLRKGMADTVLYDIAGVKERYGLRPEQLIDFKALAGDASDNIPGVKGIGPKTATELLQKYGTLEKIYRKCKMQNAKCKIKENTLKKLLAREQDAWRSQKLARVVREVPGIKLNLADCYLQNYDRAKVVALFQKLQFQSLLKNLPPSAPDATSGAMGRLRPPALNESVPKAPGIKCKSVLVHDTKTFARFLEALKQQKYFVFGVEMDQIDLRDAKLTGISFCWKKGRAYYVVPFTKRVWAGLKPIFENAQIGKGGHDTKQGVSILRSFGIEVAGLIDDSMIISYLLDPGTRAHSLTQLVFAEQGIELTPREALVGKGKDQLALSQAPLSRAVEYAAAKAEATWRLLTILKHKLKDLSQSQQTEPPFCPYYQAWQAQTLYEKMEMPLVPILAEMERTGVRLDGAVLKKTAQEFARRIAELEIAIYELAGERFNIGSPVQLRHILFEKLKLPTDGIKKTKTGYSTAAPELEKLRPHHEIVDKIFVFRELSKLKNTYLDALPELVSEKDGRLHTSFNQTVTATGRLSSSNPNLQNIPIRSDEGQKIRRAFIAAPGYELLSLDYSQIDLRVLAHFSQDAGLQESFRRQEDIHSSVAAQIFGKKLEEVTPDDRRVAKVVNFGIVYGMSAHGLAQTLRLERHQAKEYIDRYFAKHPAVKKYMADIVAFTKQHGYVETLFGRRRNLPEINSSTFGVRGGAERMAINMPIQGTASDIVKLAMFAVAHCLADYGDRARMLLQVHDELLLEVKKGLVAEVAKRCIPAMEKVCDLTVPLVVNAKTGLNWGEMK